MRYALMILVLLAQNALAQMCPCEFGKSGQLRRHELGWSLLSSMGEPGDYRLVDRAIMPILFSGMNYKYHFDKFSLRAQMAYKHYKINETLNLQPFLDPETTNGKAAFGELRFGMEKTLRPGKWRYYIGLDALYGIGKSSGSLYRYHDPQSNYIALISYYGVSLVPGLNFRTGEKFSFNLEPALNFSKNIQTLNTQMHTINRVYLLLNTLSFNYHF